MNLSRKRNRQPPIQQAKEFSLNPRTKKEKPVQLSRMGELKIIEHIRRRFAQNDQRQFTGIGDDTAILKTSAWGLGGAEDLLVTTDVLVEGVDFDLRYGSFHQVGFKAMAANLSDIAAMGGTPKFYWVILGLSGDVLLQQLDQLYEGMAELGQQYKVRLLGGDTSATRDGLFVGITVLGTVEKDRALLRSGAKAGDHIFVTGTLGEAAAGLELARTRTLHTRQFLPLLQRQFYPDPRIKEGRLLLINRIPSAMIDLSDGLASDLRHICDESRVGAVVEAQGLPRSKTLVEFARKVRKDPVEFALTGGEDFELLFTVPEGKVSHLISLARQKKLKLSRIGKILPRGSGIKLRDDRGRLGPFPSRGYEHFKS
jgi:thiamine-monophosphate kinase